MFHSVLPGSVSALSAGFAAAVEATSYESTQTFEVADAPLMLRFAGEELRHALSPAFAHLATPHEHFPSSPALTVHLWESASSGSPPPPRPTTPAQYPVGALVHFGDASLRGVYAPATKTLSVLDVEAGVGWYWVDDVAGIPHWERARPLRQMLCWWLESRGYLQLHGSAVGTSLGGVLMVGTSGSGKSVTSLSVLGSELLFAADDYCAMQVEGPPRIISLYSSGTFEPEDGTRLLRRLLPLASNPDRLTKEKAVIFAHEHFPAQTTPGFPMRAILMPTVLAGRRESRVVEAPRAAAFAALAPSTIVQMRTPSREALSVMSELVRRVPSFGLELGADTTAIPETIAEFLASGTPSG